MAEKEYKPFWFQGLVSGMDQSTDTNLVANNESPLLKNVTLDQLGNWATRKGTSRTGDRITASDRVWGLGAYNSTDGTTRYLMMVTQRDLYRLNEVTNQWDLQDSDEWTANQRVDFINHINRLYVGCEDGTTALAYTTGGAITDVTPTIGGSILAVNKNILAVGGNSILPNVIFYTNPFTDQFHRKMLDEDGTTTDTATGAANADVAGSGTLTVTKEVFEADMEGAVLYNTTDGTMVMVTNYRSATLVDTDGDTSTWDNDTVYVLQNNFKIDGRCTGMIGYQENFVAWDEDKIYFWDPTSNWSQDLPNFGCVNYRTIKVVNGLLIWANREGLYTYDSTNGIVDITGKIRDKVNGYGTWDLINDDNWGQLAAGVLPSEGIYKLSVGDLTTQAGAPASALTNVELEYDTKKQSWTLNTYPDEGVVYANFIDTDGAKGLYRGDKGTSAVYKLKTGTTDANSDATTTAISFDFRTQHHVLGDPRFENYPKKYFIKYIATNDVDVDISKDRDTYAALLDTLPASAAITVREIKPRSDQDGFSHSLKFTGTGKFILEGYGFKVLQGDTTGKPAL